MEARKQSEAVALKRTTVQRKSDRELAADATQETFGQLDELLVTLR